MPVDINIYLLSAHVLRDALHDAGEVGQWAQFVVSQGVCGAAPSEH
jgi:hypothetical protein